jgi:probable F420-dependent oxidoreductase
MKVSAGLLCSLSDVPARMATLQRVGYDGAFTAEASSDPFFPLLLGAEHSQRMELFTAIAVAFARNPMTMANVAHDLQQFSGGRFVLGLGSQIEAHITKRFSMPWSHPAARMREFVLALRAIWSCWYEGKKLDFRGEFYQHTLMTPMFTPTNLIYPPPRIRMGGVGEKMTEVAGEVADGFIAHGFTSPRYMREVTLPALQRGLVKANKSRADFEVVCPVMVATGDSEPAFIAARESIRKQIAFYGSTPAYRAVLDFHGWGDLQSELNVLSKQGRWDEMTARISDEMLHTLAVVCENPAQAVSAFQAAYGDLIDHWMCTVEMQNEGLQTQLVRALQTQPCR